MARKLAVGVDVGSTTVKAVVCDAETFDILWSDYKRHETRQPEMTLEFLVRIGEAFPDADDVKIFVTGSGSSCLLYTSPSPRDRTRSRMPSSA